MTSDFPFFLSVKDVAKAFGVTSRTVFNWGKKGYLHAHTTRGKHMRFDRLSVIKNLASMGYPIPGWLNHPPLRIGVCLFEPAALKLAEQALAKVGTIEKEYHPLRALYRLSHHFELFVSDLMPSPQWTLSFVSECNGLKIGPTWIAFTPQLALREETQKAGFVDHILHAEPGKLRAAASRLVSPDI